MDNRGLGNTGTAGRHTGDRGTGANFRTAGYEGSIYSASPAVKRPALTIYFEQNKHDLLKKEKSKLDSLAATLIKEVYSQARLVGHASTEGETQYNQLLSVKRVDAVVDYLVQIKNVRRQQLLESAVGETQPFVMEGGDEARRAMNRRVEVTIERSTLPGCLSPAQMKFIEDTIRSKREAVSILSKIRNDAEERLAQVQKEQSKNPEFEGWLYADLNADIIELRGRLSMHQRHLDDFAKAVKEGACWDRFEKLEKQRGDDIRSVTRYEERLAALRLQLKEAEANSKSTTGDQQAFWLSVVGTLEFYIPLYEDSLKATREQR